MNRLILLGNGFDLAHKMKTSYKDFIIWYLKKVFNEANSNRGFSDSLMTIQCLEPIQRFGNLNDVDELIDVLFLNDLNQLFDNQSIILPNYHHLIANPFKVSISTKFMQKVIKECHEKNWVDIENVFYEALTGNLNERSNVWDTRLTEILNAMQCMIQMLEEYLLTQKIGPEISEINSLLNSDILDEDLAMDSQGGNLPPNRTLIVDFNYTPTIEYYLKNGNNFSSHIEVNYIHG